MYQNEEPGTCASSELPPVPLYSTQTTEGTLMHEHKQLKRLQRRAELVPAAAAAAVYHHLCCARRPAAQLSQFQAVTNHGPLHCRCFAQTNG